MGPDGITAGVIERCFKKINQDDYHDFKVLCTNGRVFISYSPVVVVATGML